MAITLYQKELLDILDAPHGDLYDKTTILEWAIGTPSYFTVKSALASVEPLIRSNINTGEELYICDPRKNVECRKTNCYWYNGPCMSTTDKRFALNQETEEEDGPDLQGETT